ncbi:MAG: PAS domain S-box protein, partial [Sideroxyarcus sp.]|nr:PAS domain S-box protein [Sideroxyarcus sp.]
GYWIFLITTWVAVRLGTRETVVVLVMTAIYALLGAIQGVGFFADDIAQTHLVNYWLFMVTLSIVGMALATHFTERKQLETMLRKRTDELALHNQVLQQISLGAPLCEVLEELARQVEALHPGMLCSILLVAEDGKHLRHGAAPGLPDFYNQAINGLAIGDGMGACGTAAYRGERVIVEDVQQHAYWPGPYRDLARQAGVQSCWSQPIKDSHGRVLGTFAIYHHRPAQPSDDEIALIERYADLAAIVIERIRIQDDLRLKDLALNAAANAVVITGKDAQIKWANRAFSKLSGYDLSEAIGRPPKELVKSGKQSQSYYEALWQTILSGEVWHGELVNRRKDGSLYHEEMTITPVPDAQGEITHFIAVKQDITERKQAEELLRESEQQFRQLAENIREAFWMTDPAKNKMLYISPAYEQIWGRTLQSIYDSPRAWLEAIHGEDRQRVLHAALTRQSVGLYDEEYRIVRPNGDIRWIHDRAFPVHDGMGAVYRIVGVAEDITERK